MGVLDAVEVMSPFVAEFLGTYLLVFTAGSTVVTDIDPIWIPMGSGLALMVATLGLSSVSQAHFNPSISLAFFCCGRMRFTTLLGYLCCQTLAGFAAACYIWHVHSKKIVLGAGDYREGLGSMALEAGCTMVLCFVTLNCVASSRNSPPGDRNQFAAVAIGFAAIAGVFATLNGGCAFMNPAVSLGYGMLWPSKEQWYWTLLYGCAQVLGGMGASVLFFLVRPEELQVLVTGNLIGAASRRLAGGVESCTSCLSRRHREHGDESQQTQSYSLPTKFTAELVGTYVVVFAFILTVSSPPRMPDGATTTTTTTEAGTPARRWYEANPAPWASAAALIAMTYSLADISHAYFNPATVLGVFFSGRNKCRWYEVVAYLTAHASACIAAGLSTWLLLPTDRVHGDDIRLSPRAGYTWGALGLESVFAFALTMVYLCVCTLESPRYSKAPHPHGFQFGLAVGFAAAAGGMALRNITGGFLNPAVAGGITVDGVFAQGGWLDRPARFAAYASCEAAGSLCAGLVFAMLHPLEYKKDPLDPHTHA